MTKKRIEEESLEKFSSRLTSLCEGENTSKGKTSNAELHRSTNISNQAISNYKNGLANPSLYNATKIANYFGVSLDYLSGVAAHPIPEMEALSTKLGLSAGTLYSLINIQNRNDKHSKNLIKTVEDLIKYAYNEYCDALIPISNYLNLDSLPDIYYITEEAISDLNDLIYKSNSIKEVKENVSKALYDTSSANDKFLKINDEQIYLQAVMTSLSKLRYELLPNEDSYNHDDEPTYNAWVNPTEIDFNKMQVTVDHIIGKVKDKK